MDASLIPQWITAMIALVTIFGVVLTAYIKYQTDKTKIEKDFESMDSKIENNKWKTDKRMEIIEKDLKQHLIETEKINRDNRDENREEHRLLFKRLDEIKNYMIDGKFKD